jgi:lysophospholipase L1-like esterase
VPRTLSAVRTACTGAAVALALAASALAAPTAAQAAPHIQPVPATYVALGDSYSSGEGGGRPTLATDTATNRCHRDVRAYPVRLSQRDRDLRPLAFVACSGAVTSDLVTNNHLYPSEGPQLPALTSATRAVTITIGGNDAGFAQVLEACIAVRGLSDGRGCSSNPVLTGAVDARLGALAATKATPGLPIIPLRQVLAQIHARSPRAHVYVAAYPELFGSRKRDFSRDASAPSGRSCVVNPLAGASFDRADTQWLNRNTRRLNGILRQSVRDAKAADRSLRATFVRVPAFDGHGLCDAKQSWINPLVLAPSTTPAAPPAVDPVSFHPTPKGQKKGYYRAFRRAGI